MFFPAAAWSAIQHRPRGRVAVPAAGGVIAGVIAVTQAQRKVPVQYAQRAVGRKIIPAARLSCRCASITAGVMPIIFAQAILMFPQQIFLLFVWKQPFRREVFHATSRARWSEGALLYMTVYTG